MAVNGYPHTNHNDEHEKAKNAGRLLHLLSRKHFQYCENKFQSLGIGPGQVPILMELGKYGQLSQRDLAEKVHVTPATISGTLKRLERGGIIVRTGTEDDARVSLVSLSESGEALMKEARSVFAEADDLLVNGFTPLEKDELLRLLERMLENVHEGMETNRKEGEKE